MTILPDDIPIFHERFNHAQTCYYGSINFVFNKFQQITQKFSTTFQGLIDFMYKKNSWLISIKKLYIFYKNMLAEKQDCNSFWVDGYRFQIWE